MALSNLDLTNDELQSSRILRPGRYRVISRDATYEAKDAQREAVIVTFDDMDGQGSITHYFNYRNPNEDATRIGRSQLKTFLTHGKHPDPNRPSTTASMVGLKLVITVEKNGTYVSSKSGKTLDRYQVSQFQPYTEDGSFGPTEAPQAKAASGGVVQSGVDSMDDEIPF